MEVRGQEHKEDSLKDIRLEQARRYAEIKQQEDQELRQKQALKDIRNDILQIVSAELQDHRQAEEDLNVENNASARVVFEEEDDMPSMTGLYRDRLDHLLLLRNVPLRRRKGGTAERDPRHNKL
jgi:hypothetical protein